MVDVKPDEISAILKQQLSGFKTEAELEEVGTVLQVGDGIASVYGFLKHKLVNWWNSKMVFRLSYLTLKKTMWVWYFGFWRRYQGRVYE
jgi:F0F1-type ATP synthase alpha subunit